MEKILDIMLDFVIQVHNLINFYNRREAVTSVSVHPTGRLALSVSTDKSLR